MKAAFTPGPWRVIETNLLAHTGDHVADISNGLMVVAMAKLGDPLADAQLIAATPELLKALIELTSDVTDRFDMSSATTNSGMKVLVKQSLAAITKATGSIT